MKLEQYISKLLYQYDCVIVPGLGGFVANYKSATIQPVQNTFSPPSKGISFNKNLNNNDGLLANFIAQEETVSFEEASKKITTDVAQINTELHLNRRFELLKIGVLFLDAENRIQFEPVNTTNYLLTSYGLPIYQKHPIKRVTLESKITQQFVDRTKPSAAVRHITSQKSNAWLYSAALVLLAFGAGWMTNNSDWSNELNYANLNPYANNAKAVYSPLPPTVSALPQVKEISLQEQLNAADEKDTYMELTIDENPFIVQLKEAAVEIPDSTYVEKAKIVLQYHIVTGCFSEERNAEKMVRNLKKQGFDARIVGKRKGLWTVSCNSFETKREARNALSYAQDYNAKAWILNHSF